jgi:hypothetical protein
MKKEATELERAGLARRKEGVARLELRQPGPAPTAGPPLACGPARSAGSRWTAGRKLEVVLRLVRGEAVDVLSRELGVEIARLEDWRARGLSGLEAGLKECGQDPRAHELAAAKQHIAELSLNNELLRMRCEKQEARFRSRRLGP